jgi:hypothetical protein
MFVLSVTSHSSSLMSPISLNVAWCAALLTLLQQRTRNLIGVALVASLVARADLFLESEGCGVVAVD